MAIAPIRLYDIYLSTSIHFKGTGFNAVKYNFHTRVSEAALEKNRAKQFFYRLAPTFKDDAAAILFMVSNFIAGKKWVGEFNKKEENAFLSYKESLAYRFEEDVKIKFENGFPSLKAY